MVDVVFEEPQLRPISARKSDGFLVALLVNNGIAKSAASARVMLLATGLVCFSAALFLFLRTVNEPPLNTQRVIPPGFENQQS